MNYKLLIGIPPKNHINLALDEVYGLSDLGYNCETIVYTRNEPRANKIKKLIGVIRNALTIISKLKQCNPDILYLNSRFEPSGSTRDFITILLIRSLYWSKLKIAIKTHGSDLSIITNNSRFYKWIVIPYLTKEVDLWFFLSHEEKTNISKYAPELAEKICVTCNIIDPKRSIQSKTFLEKQGINNALFKFFFAGRMIAEKGIFEIIRAISKFKHKNDCIFIFAGDGPDYNQFQQEIKESKLNKYVYLTGFLPEEECDHFYANVDALVFPTYFDEGFPMALFKSVGCGLPVITTKTRAAVDHLKEPENCLWVKDQDSHSVLQALTTLYENRDLRQNMSLENLKLGEHFTRQKIAEQMHEDFSKILHPTEYYKTHTVINPKQ